MHRAYWPTFIYQGRILSSRLFIARNGTYSSIKSSRGLGSRFKWSYSVAAILLTTGVVGGIRKLRNGEAYPPLNSETFSTFTLLSKEKVSLSSSIFVLAPATKIPIGPDFLDCWKKGIWSVQVKQPQLQIARHYSPLPSYKSEAGSPQIRLLIRKEPQGEVSSYLHNLSAGSDISLRGPYLQYEIPQNVYEIVFIAGGTGIAPALQVASNIFDVQQPTDAKPRMHILWANRRRDEISRESNNTSSMTYHQPSVWDKLFKVVKLAKKDDFSPLPSPTPLVQELECLKTKAQGHLSVDYFVDEEDSFITSRVLNRAIQGYSSSPPEVPKKKLLLISGPDGFVEHYAGPKVWQSGKEAQGPLGGVLKQINLRHWTVWKL